MIKRPTYAEYRRWGHPRWVALTLSTPFSLGVLIAAVLGIILGVLL